jgi:hypothetical protein
MKLNTRLRRLERLQGAASVRHHDAEEEESLLSDDEEADRMGASLWQKDMIDREYGMLRRNYPSSDYGEAKRAWDDAMDAALAAGCTEYHAGLRPLAMPIWLLSKPDILEHQRTHGTWVWDEPPRGASLLTLEEFRALPPENQVRQLRDTLSRKGHWTKDPRHQPRMAS